MKKIVRAFPLLLIMSLLVGLCACGGNNVTGYMTAAELAESDFRVAFREGDRLCEEVTAALQVLSAQGKLRELSVHWFGEDLSMLNGDANALSALGEISPRSLIVGVTPGSMPMSWRTGEAYTGFDAELAEAVCGLLGWELRFISIEDDQAALYLAAGEVDCVWSGRSFEDVSGVSCSPAYLKNAVIVVANADSGIKSLKKLKGRVVGMSGDTELASAFESSEAATLPESIRSCGSTESCFNALRNGLADAIVTDSAALMYYSK